MKCSIKISEVLAIHQDRISSITVPVTKGQGVISRISGKQCRMIDLSVPSVILLTEDSTPQVQILDESAETSFTSAVEKLVKTGQKFYTQLRPNWCLPAILWEKVS